MKRFSKLTFIILIPFVVGLILQTAGTDDVAYAGGMIMSLGTALTAIVVFVVGMVMMITGKLHLGSESGNGSSDDGSGTPISKINLGKKADEEGKACENVNGNGDSGSDGVGRLSKELGQTAAESEAQKLNNINSSYGRESQLKQGEYIAGQSASIYKNSTTKEKVLGWLFFGFLMVNFTLAIIFFFFRINLGAFICMGLFGGTLIIAIIAKVIAEKTGLSIRRRRMRRPDEWIEKQGTVKFCAMSSMGSYGGGSPHSSVRVHEVTYKVTVTVEGQEYICYTSRFFEAGESVTVFIDKSGKSKLASIV